MSTSVVKQTLHELIDRIEDDDLLLLYMKLLEREIGKSSTKDFFNTTTSDMIRRAEMSEQDIAAGRTINAQQFKVEIENWKKQKNPNTK